MTSQLYVIFLPVGGRLTKTLANAAGTLMIEPFYESCLLSRQVTEYYWLCHLAVIFMLYSSRIIWLSDIIWELFLVLLSFHLNLYFVFGSLWIFCHDLLRLVSLYCSQVYAYRPCCVSLTSLPVCSMPTLEYGWLVSKRKEYLTRTGVLWWNNCNFLIIFSILKVELKIIIKNGRTRTE